MGPRTSSLGPLTADHDEARIPSTHPCSDVSRPFSQGTNAVRPGQVEGNQCSNIDISIVLRLGSPLQLSKSRSLDSFIKGLLGRMARDRTQEWSMSHANLPRRVEPSIPLTPQGHAAWNHYSCCWHRLGGNALENYQCSTAAKVVSVPLATGSTRVRASRRTPPTTSNVGKT